MDGLGPMSKAKATANVPSLEPVEEPVGTQIVQDPTKVAQGESLFPQEDLAEAAYQLITCPGIVRSYEMLQVPSQRAYVRHACVLSKSPKIVATISSTGVTLHRPRVIEQHIDRMQVCERAAMLQQIPRRDLLSTAIAAQMVDEQLGVTCTSLPPKSKAASRGQATLSVKCQRSLQKLHHGYRTNVEHDVVARTCMTHEQRRRRKSCKAHKKTFGLLREAFDLNEEHITTITQRTNVLERERHSTKLAFESAERLCQGERLN